MGPNPTTTPHQNQRPLTMTADSPEGWTERPTRSEVEAVLDKIEAEAATHAANYAAGMREARRIMETELEY
jgi:hypothetical protein